MPGVPGVLIHSIATVAMGCKVTALLLRCASGVQNLENCKETAHRNFAELLRIANSTLARKLLIAQNSSFVTHQYLV